jgi:hypothetical protein
VLNQWASEVFQQTQLDVNPGCRMTRLVSVWLFDIAMGNGPFIEVYLLKIVIFHGYVK